MKKVKFFSFWLLLSLGMAAVVFNSCGKDDDSKNGGGADNISVTGISLDRSTLSLAIGEEYTLMATVTPNSATNKTVTWTSSDNTKATVVNGKVKALTAGTVTITAKAGNQTVTCTITVTAATITDPFTDKGVIINGVKWATRNVAAPGKFAATPESSGMFYQWNRKAGWSVTDPRINSNGDTYWSDRDEAGSMWAKVNDPSPNGWRVPTEMEIRSLLDGNVNREWTTQNGVSGTKFTDRTSGNSMFLPASGSRSFSGTLRVEQHGRYWSSTPFWNGNSFAYYLAFDRNERGEVYNGYRSNGYSVRPVAE